MPADVKPLYRLTDIDTAMAGRRHELGRGFDVNNLTVIAADLTDKPERQRLYERKLKWNMPRARLQLEPAMEALARGDQQPSAESIRAALKPYRNKTIIIMGHVKGKSPTMRWSPLGRPIDIEIALWVDLAGDEGVNLLILGCKSAGVADIGSVNIVNSNALLDKLIAVLRAPPDTFKHFYAGLSGPDHVIAFNPFNEGTTYVSARIEHPDGGKAWTIEWRPPGSYSAAPSAPPAPTVPITSSSDLSALLTARCDTSTRTRKDHETCLTKANATVSGIDKMRREADDKRAAAETIRQTARAARKAERQYWITAAVVGAVILVLAWLNVLFRKLEASKN